MQTHRHSLPEQITQGGPRSLLGGVRGPYSSGLHDFLNGVVQIGAMRGQ